MSFTADDNIWIKQLGHGALTKFTLAGGNYSAWTPDGRAISYYVQDKGKYSLWKQPADGGPAMRVMSDSLNPVESLWSADGKWFIARTSATGGSADIYAQRLDVDGSPKPLLATKATEMQPALSPNSRWLALTSDETGRYDVYVVPFPDASSARWKVLFSATEYASYPCLRTPKRSS
jgi:Tol biopolymer transport system component